MDFLNFLLGYLYASQQVEVKPEGKKRKGCLWVMDSWGCSLSIILFTVFAIVLMLLMR